MLLCSVVDRQTHGSEGVGCGGAGMAAVGRDRDAARRSEDAKRMLRVRNAVYSVDAL